MDEYFTVEHFALLNKWQGKKYDPMDAAQRAAYEQLRESYDLVAVWARQLQEKLFPQGVVDVRRRPTNQANNFAGYQWAKIYPTEEAPKKLAYTVSISAANRFEISIDTVALGDEDPIRLAYRKMRGSDDSVAPFIARLDKEAALEKSMSELVDWTIDAIKNFRMGYEEVADALELNDVMTDEDLLKHFDSKPVFKTFRSSWSSVDKALFCRLARAVHSAGLDWWHTGSGVHVRFGRKNAGSERAEGVLGVIRGTRGRTITLTRGIGDVPKMHRAPLDENLVVRMEAALASERKALKDWFPLEMKRAGLWPDRLREDNAERSEMDEDMEDQVIPDENLVMRPFNRIYYGPPGTGKTYELGRILKTGYEQVMTSSSNEEWRAEAISERIAGLKWWQAAAAALYDVGGKATVKELISHPFIQALITAAGRTKHVPQTLWQTLNSHAVSESTTVKQRTRTSPSVFDKSPDSVWTLAGDWRDACADLIDMVDGLKAGQRETKVVQRYSFVTFHQSYGYEDFIEGLRPVLDADAESENIQYEIRAGVFKELCRKARLVPSQRFAMVIDEINRGNISKIFGELITLIEPDKREGMPNAVPVILPYSGESFAVPPNVDIIGTMNTADRSLALLDTALRRRFDFIPLMPDCRDLEGAPLHGLRVTSGTEVIDIPKMLDAMNQRIEALYDRDHCIGHAYFTSLKQVADGDDRLVALGQIFSNRILPLLEEYFFEDWQKIRLVLADNQKAAPARFVAEGQDQEDDLSRLFGNDHRLENYATRRRYTVRDKAFANPAAYTGIYQTLKS